MAADNVDSAAEPSASPFLGRELRVELKDGRVVVGLLLAYQGSGDMLLQRVVEQRRLKDGHVVLRRPPLLAIPFKHVVSVQRRKEGVPPEEQDEGLVSNLQLYIFMFSLAFIHTHIWSAGYQRVALFLFYFVCWLSPL
eukprot:gene7598-5359_t